MKSWYDLLLMSTYFKPYVNSWGRDEESIKLNTIKTAEDHINMNLGGLYCLIKIYYKSN